MTAIAMSLALCSTAHAQGKKYALLVGVKDYDTAVLTPLQYSEDDVLAMGRSLEKHGFDVISMTSQARLPAHKPGSAKKILALVDGRLKGLTGDDTIVLALSGHGLQFKDDPALPDGSKETYFCPEEADPKDRSSLLPISTLLAKLGESPAGRKLVIIDACRNEVAAKGNKAVEQELEPAGVNPRTVPKGTLVLFSCASREKSFEFPDVKHGAFCYHVLKYLDGEADPLRYPNDRLSVTELAAYASRETRDLVFRKLAKDQTPELINRGTDWSLGGIRVLPPPLFDATHARTSAEAKAAQEAWAKHLKTTVEVENSIGMKLVLIPPGEYLCGSPDSDKDAYDNEKPQHRVRITKEFYLGMHEVTQGEWKAVMFTAPWLGEPYVKTGKDYPATYVSWDDAQEFCRKLSDKDGRTYRLPTEAEWEYAARGGTTTRFSFGDDEVKLSEYAWYGKNAYDVDERYAHQVGLKKANPFGLYDMHGNVYEWCSDWYDEKEYAKHAGRTVQDPQGPQSGSSRVFRGGSWSDGPLSVRSAYRFRGAPVYRFSYLGFRVASVPSVK